MYFIRRLSDINKSIITPCICCICNLLGIHPPSALIFAWSTPDAPPRFGALLSGLNTTTKTGGSYNENIIGYFEGRAIPKYGLETQYKLCRFLAGPQVFAKCRLETWRAYNFVFSKSHKYSRIKQIKRNPDNVGKTSSIAMAINSRWWCCRGSGKSPYSMEP